MTLRTDMSGLFAANASPQSVTPEGIVRWVGQAFANLRQFLIGPEFSSVLLLRVDVTLPTDFKPEDGMLIYAGAGVLGSSAGLYLRDGGAWHKVTTS